MQPTSGTAGWYCPQVIQRTDSRRAVVERGKASDRPYNNLLILLALALMACSPSFGQTPPSGGSGLVGYWPLDSANVVGNQALDSSGNNLHGTLLGGVTSTTGMINQGLSFDGRTGFIQFPTDTLTDLTSDISLALWINTLNNSRTEALLSRYSAAGMETGYLLRTDAAGHVELRIGGNSSSRGYAVTLTDTGKFVNDGRWHHVAAVITLGQDVSFYIDGALSSSQAISAIAHAGGLGLKIGLTPIYYGSYFTGSLDDVRIYNRALLASEIAALANVSAPGGTPVPTPSLSVSPLNLSFNGISGSSNPPTQAVNVSNSGGGMLSWTASASQPWITLSSSSGTGGQTISVGATLTGRAAGTYSGTVIISAAGATPSVQTVNLTLVVTTASPPPPPPPPTGSGLSVSPLNLSFNGISGSSNPPTQAVNVSNSGGGMLSWTASASQPWITLSSSSGTGGQTISVGATLTGRAAGTYSGTVIISAAGATPSVQTVNLTLVVTIASPPPPPPPPTGSGGSHYAAPNGTPFGDGSSSQPWDLQTALNQPSSVVQPGDTIWLRNGVYGNGGTIFQSNLNGTSTQPITVRQYVGESVTVNGGLQVNGTYTRYWGFEVTNMGIANRNSNTSGQSPPPNFPSGFSIFGTGNQFINLIVHDTAEGFGFWTAAQGGEIYGSVIYNNGWQGLDRGHGHGIYTQNQNGVKTISDNIIFQGFGEGVQCYGSSAAYVQNYVYDGNTIFNSGTLAGNHQYNLLITGGHGPQNITVTNNYTYHTPSDNIGISALDWGGQTPALNLTATGNYFIGGNPALQAFNWNGATFTGNTTYSQGGYTLAAGNLQTSTYDWNQNTYYGGGLQLNSQGQTFTSWQSATGLDKNSTYSSSAPTGTWVFVRPNRYEAGRANITIYNWDLANSVSVDVSNVLSIGSHFEVRNAQDFFGAPVVLGTYNGGSISIPMAGLSVALPQGTVPNKPNPVGPVFGAFVLLQQ